MSEEAVYSHSDIMKVMVAVCAGVIIMPLMSTMMNLALNHIGEEFEVGAHSLGMVSTIFFLASVIVMVPAARISEIYGRKRTFSAGLLVVMVASIAAMFSVSFEMLLVSRGLMGVGAAAMFGSGMTIVTDVVPLEKRGSAIGIYTTFIYLGLALGPSLGGFISDAVGWRYIFFFMIPFATVSLLSISTFKKEIYAFPDAKMDVKGSAVYGLAIMFSMYGMINLPQLWAVFLLAIGLAFLALFIFMEKRMKFPVLELNIFRYGMFSRSCVAALLNYGSSYSVSFFLALYLTSIGALSAFEAGLIMLLQPLVQVFLTAKAGSMSDRIDSRILPTMGMGLTSVAILMLIFVGIVPDFYFIAAILMLLGLGYALFSAPNTNVIMSSVPGEFRGEASGVLALMRQTGTLVSMGIAMCCISVIMGSTDNLGPDTYDEFVTVMRVAFSICLALCVVGTFISWFRGSGEGISGK